MSAPFEPTREPGALPPVPLPDQAPAPAADVAVANQAPAVVIPESLRRFEIDADTIRAYGFDPENQADVDKFNAVYTLGRMSARGQVDTAAITAAHQSGFDSGYQQGLEAAQADMDEDDDEEETPEEAAAQGARTLEANRPRPAVKKLGAEGVDRVSRTFADRWPIRVEYPDVDGRPIVVLDDEYESLESNINRLGLSVPPLDSLQPYITEGVTEVVAFDTVPGQTYRPFTGEALEGRLADYNGDDVVVMRYAAPVNLRHDGRGRYEDEKGGVSMLTAVLPRSIAERIQARLAADQNPELAVALLEQFIDRNVDDEDVIEVANRIVPPREDWKQEGGHYMVIRSDLYPQPSEAGTGEEPEVIVVPLGVAAEEKAATKKDDEGTDKAGSVRRKILDLVIGGVGSIRRP